MYNQEMIIFNAIFIHLTSILVQINEVVNMNTRENAFFNIETEEEMAPEILEMIYKKVDSSDLDSLSATCRFFYNNLQNYKSPEFIKRNIENSNYEKRIFNGQDEKILKIAAWRNFIIATSFNRVQAYDTRTGKILWTFSGESVLHDKLWIIDGKVVCNGWEIINGSYQHRGNTILSILEIETGKVLQTIRHPLLQSGAIIAFGKHIIAKLNNGEIFSADSAGKFKKYASQPSFAPMMFANEHYIVDVCDRRTGVKIINRETAASNTIALNPNNREGIYCATITKNILICGLVDSATDLLFVDLHKAEIIKKFKIDNLFTHDYPTSGGIRNIPGIHSVVANSQYVFMAHECGMVVGVNLNDYSHTVLENGLTPHSLKLSLQDNYLFIISTEEQDAPSSLHIWDTETMQKVSSSEISGLHEALLWHKGQLFIASEKSLIKFDFKVPHKGISLATGSPHTVEIEERNGNQGCVIS